jgi:hypothetical protein
MAIAILIIPLSDTFRVFMLRLMRKQSPFKADRNHMHHVLLDLGLNHRGVALTLYSVNVLFIFTDLLLRDISSFVLLLTICGIAVLVSAIPFVYKAMYRKSKQVNMKMY